MGAMTTYLKNKLLDHAAGVTEYTMPTDIYLAAFVGDPETISGAEVDANTTTGYGRQAVTMDSAASGSQANTAAVEFPVANASWGTITHLAIFDAESGGNRLWSDQMSASKTIGEGDTFTVAIGDLDLTLT